MNNYPLLTEEKRQEILSILRWRDALHEMYDEENSSLPWAQRDYAQVEMVAGDLAEECGLLYVACLLHWNPETPDLDDEPGNATHEMQALGVKRFHPRLVMNTPEASSLVNTPNP